MLKTSPVVIAVYNHKYSVDEGMCVCVCVCVRACVRACVWCMHVCVHVCLHILYILYVICMCV